MPGVRRRVYEILELAVPGDRVSRAWDIFIIFLICANVVALILASVENINQAAPQVFIIFESASVAVFAIEYILRVWSYAEDPSYTHPVRSRIRFILSPIQLLDLLAILPSLLLLVGLDLRPLRVVRLVARAARLSRYFVGLRTLGDVLHARRHDIFTVTIVLGVLLVLASSLMYFAERLVQPEAFSSIPATMWWTIVTLTTVGYGDVFPVTIQGRLLAGVIAVLGIGIFALPAGILGSGFLEQVQQRESENAQQDRSDEVQQRRGLPRTCPYCGLEIAD